MKFLIYPFAILSALSVCLQARGSEAVPSDSTSTREISVHFKCARSVIEPNYKDNREALDSLTRLLSEMMATGQASEIQITGAASPEGGVSYNYGLSKRRADAISKYLANQINFPDSSINFKYLGRDWEGLKRYVESDNNVPYRDELLTLLNQLTQSDEKARSDSQDGMTLLRKIGKGKTFGYLYSTYFPALRASRVLIPEPHRSLLQGMEITDRIEDIALVPTPPALILNQVSLGGKPGKPFYIALKTNMLLDAALIPSIGAEFYLGKNISVVANWAYGWWDKDSSHLYWRYYGGDLAARWWFGKAAHEKPLTGHHIGIYGGVFTYDFELGGTGYMGGRPGHPLWARCLANAGIEYGYSLPVAKRLNIDFTVGLGYIGGKYIKYHPHGGHYIEDSMHKVRWFGPSKAEISLVWLIGRGNVNQKGGSR